MLIHYSISAFPEYGTATSVNVFRHTYDVKWWMAVDWHNAEWRHRPLQRNRIAMLGGDEQKVQTYSDMCVRQLAIAAISGCRARRKRRLMYIVGG